MNLKPKKSIIPKAYVVNVYLNIYFYSWMFPCIIFVNTNSLGSEKIIPSWTTKTGIVIRIELLYAIWLPNKPRIKEIKVKIVILVDYD